MGVGIQTVCVDAACECVCVCVYLVCAYVCMCVVACVEACACTRARVCVCVHISTILFISPEPLICIRVFVDQYQRVVLVNSRKSLDVS